MGIYEFTKPKIQSELVAHPMSPGIFLLSCFLSVSLTDVRELPALLEVCHSRLTSWGKCVCPVTSWFWASLLQYQPGSHAYLWASSWSWEDRVRALTFLLLLHGLITLGCSWCMCRISVGGRVPRESCRLLTEKGWWGRMLDDWKKQMSP